MSDGQTTATQPSGSPPGNQYVSKWWIIGIGAGFLVLTVLLFSGLFWLWPSCKPPKESLPPKRVSTAEKQTQPQASPGPAIPIEVDSISPNSGPVDGNTEVTIYGKEFKDGTTVRFGGIPGETI